MKKYLLLLSVFLSTLSLAAQNTASFTIESKPITAGETVELNVTIKNSQNTKTSAFQFDLEVPEGLTFERTSTTLVQYFKMSNALKNLGEDGITYNCLSSSQSGDGNPVTKIRVILYEGNANVPFSTLGLPNEFVIGTVKVKAADNFSGAANITMDGAIIAGSGGEGGIGGDSSNDFQVVTPDGKVVDPKEPAADGEVYIKPTGFSFAETTLSVASRSTATITATAQPTNNYPITWTSNKPEVATVADGVVTGVSAGTATITGSIAGGSLSATCTVTVTAPDPTGITLNKESIALKVGASETLTATIEPANSSVAKPTWTSSAETVATVDENGVVTGVKAGYATIYAIAGMVSASCTVTVTNVYVTKVEVDTENSSTSLKAGQTEQFHALLTGENNEPATDQTITWSLSGENAGLATIDAATGEVTINSNITVDDIGKTITIIATSKAGAPDDEHTKGTEVTGEATITIVPTPISKISLEIDPENGEIMDGKTATIKASIEPATATYPTVTFTIPQDAKVTKNESDPERPNILTVVAGATTGETTITATPSTKVDGDCAGVSFIIEVIATPVSGITITTEPNATSMKGGTSMTFSGEVAPATATDKTIKWSVDDETLATFTEGGVLTAKTGVTGSVTVTATAANGVTATKTITIIGVEVTAITVEPIEKTLAQGENVTITATLTGENIDGKDVEPTDKTITWTAAWAADATFDGTAPAVADFVTVENGTVNVVKVTPETATKKVVITAKPNGATTGITATCTITLAKTNVTGVSVAAPKGTAANPELKQGETIQLTAIVAPDNATYQTVTWTSSSEEDVTVSEDGLVTIIKVTPETVGTEVTITATTDDPDATSVNGTFTIKLAATPVKTVKVDLENATLLVGTKVTGNVTTIEPKEATIKTLDFTSDKEGVATIADSDNTFTITGVSAGTATATIAATKGTEDAKATVNVTVNAELTITTEARENPETKDSQVAKTRQIKYTANTTLPLIWSIVSEVLAEPATDKPEVNTTDENTEEPSIDGGDGTTDEPSTDEPGTDTPAGDGHKVAFIYEHGNDPETGMAYCLVEGIAPGNAIVTATVALENLADGVTEAPTATDNIEVINVIAAKLTISDTKLSISKDDIRTITATLEPEEGVEEPVSIQEVEWTVSNDKVLQVEEKTDLTITFKAIANGTCTITAKTIDSSDLTAECTITVAPTVTGIEAAGIDETEGADIRVYDLSGNCVATTAEQYARLGEGFYIIRTATRTVKVLKTDAIPAGL